MIGFDQKPNDRRKAEGIVRRLRKERDQLNKLSKKYPVDSQFSLEDYADDLLERLEKTPSEWTDYKTLNRASRQQ
jgi:hypothetical protein